MTENEKRDGQAYFRTGCGISAKPVIASFILGISKLPCPTQVFTSEETAIQWLRGYIEEHEGEKKP